MKSIETLERELALVNEAHKSQVDAIEKELRKEYHALFADLSWIKGIEKRLYASKQWCTDEFDGFPQQWERFTELRDVPENAREYFQEYLDENIGCCSVDWNHETIAMNYGPAIMVSLDDGSAYDQDARKEISNVKDFETIDEFKASIENYMEATGCYPGVFKADRYGNLWPYNTQKKGE